MKKTIQEVTEEPAEEEKYYVIGDIHIENHGAGTINITIIQQGQPVNPGPKPPGQ